MGFRLTPAQINRLNQNIQFLRIILNAHLDENRLRFLNENEQERLEREIREIHGIFIQQLVDKVGGSAHVSA